MQNCPVTLQLETNVSVKQCNSLKDEDLVPLQHSPCRRHCYLRQLPVTEWFLCSPQQRFHDVRLASDHFGLLEHGIY